MEDDIVLDEPLLPEDLDQTHESMSIQGSMDALDGNESYCVRYLAGAMVGSGMLPGNAVHGNESVWSTVKTGFSKSIQYIRNIFTGIWGFFFGKDSEEKDTKEDAEIKAETAELEKADSGAEMSSSVKEAIVSAADKAKALGQSAVQKAKAGIVKAKIMADDMHLQEKLEAAIEKLGAVMESVQATARKQGLGIALAVSIRAQLWAAYFVKFRGIITADIKAAANKTSEMIKKIEDKIKSGSETVSDEVRERLASLKETMKSYSIIQNMKTTFRSLIKSMVDKLTIKSFRKKEA